MRLADRARRASVRVRSRRARRSIAATPRAAERRRRAPRRPSSRTSIARPGDRPGRGRARRRAQRQTVEQRARQRRAPLPHEGLRARRRRLQRDHRGVPEHRRATPTRSGSAARRSTRARLPRGAPRLPRARRARQRAALPAVLRQGARAPRRRVASPRTIRRGARRVFEKLNQVPPRRSTRRCTTRRARRYYARATTWNARRRVRSRSPNGTPYTHQARYFQGLVAMKQARPAPAPSAANAPPRRASARAANYKPAIEAFRVVTDLPPDTDEHRHVIDLSWMAIGRLLYEMEQYQQAARGLLEGRSRLARVRHDALRARVGLRPPRRRPARRARARGAPGRRSRARRTSATARCSAPISSSAPARSTRRSQLYEGVRTQYDPMRAKVEAFLDSTKDVGVYYDKLSQQQLDSLDQNEQLPPLAVRWAREAEDGPLAFAVIDDVNQCKTLIRQSTQLIDKLTTLTARAEPRPRVPRARRPASRRRSRSSTASRAPRLDARAGPRRRGAGDLGGEIGDGARSSVAR